MSSIIWYIPGKSERNEIRKQRTAIGALVRSRDAYEEADSLRTLADELNIRLLKLRKLLITADVFISDICTEINDLYHRLRP